MNILLFDDPAVRPHLLPLTFTRPVADLRCGIMTIREKWEHIFMQKTAFLAEPYLMAKFPYKIEKENLLINGCLLPDEGLSKSIIELKKGEALHQNGLLLAAHVREEDMIKLVEVGVWPALENTEYIDAISAIKRLWHIFSLNGEEIKKDFVRLTRGRKSEPINETNRVLNREAIFLEEGVKMDFVTLNASTGPIYIGAGCEIMENSVIRGPFAMLDKSVVKLASKIYGNTTLGPRCTGGGEINNSVFWGYSNKGHDGFLGNSVLGQWCNLGADTNNSNLKNDYGDVKLWDYDTQRFEDTGLQFCGLIMGDHSKSGINTMFNTGTVVGVSTNVFGSGFPRNFIPSYSWGGEKGFTTYRFDKALETAKRVMARRDQIPDQDDIAILQHVFDHEQQGHPTK